MVFNEPAHTLDLKFNNFAANPSVVDQLFDYEGPPQALYLQFDKNVSASLTASDFHLQNLTSGATINLVPNDLQYDTGLNTSTLKFSGYTYGALPDGNYRLTIFANDVRAPDGTPMASDYTLDFFSLLGDANHDRRVNIQDFNVLASHYNQSFQTFSTGDFNYDSVVNVQDFNILAARYNTVLSAPTGAMSSSGATPGTGIFRNGPPSGGLNAPTVRFGPLGFGGATQSASVSPGAAPGYGSGGLFSGNGITNDDDSGDDVLA
jgi:hypothetical protein